MNYRDFNMKTYILPLALCFGIAPSLLAETVPSQETPVQKVSLDNMLQVAVDSASPSELAYIENGLANLRDMSSEQKEELRAYIMQIALREDRQIFQYEERFRRQKITQNYVRQMHDLFSVSPKLIKKSRKHSLEVEKALNEPLYDVKEVIENIDYDVNSNQTIQVPLVSGMVNQLVFFDNTGSPWEVTNTSGGSGFKLDVHTKTKNVVTIKTTELFRKTNGAIFLKGLNYAVPLTLTSNTKVNATRLSVRLKQRSPDTKVQYLQSEKQINDDDRLIMLANGYPPSGGSPVRIDLEGTEAWLVDDALFIRTMHKLYSPAAIEQRVSQSAGIASVYKVNRASVLYFGVDWQSKPLKVAVNDYAIRAYNELEDNEIE